MGTTQNRNQERNNQAALIDFVRGLATVRFAARVGTVAYRDREQARARRDSSTEALDAREADANTRVFRALRGLRAAVVEHVREELLRLPPVIVATPASVQPSLAIASVYEDIGRAADIVGRITLPRPGFRAGQPDYASGGVRSRDINRRFGNCCRRRASRTIGTSSPARASAMRAAAGRINGRRRVHWLR